MKIIQKKDYLISLNDCFFLLLCYNHAIGGFMCTEEMQMIMGIVITILDIIKFIVPIVLIIFCTIDIFKIIVSKKEDEIKKLRKDVFMKIVYCIIIYLIPFIVPFILKFASNIIPMEYDDSWKNCWDYVKKNKNDIKIN